MKKIIYLTLATMFIASCSSNNTEEMTSEDLKSINADCDCAQLDFKRNAFGNKINGSLIYDIQTKEVFNGSCEEKYGNDTRKEIKQYSHGKLHGHLATWDENGNLRRHLIFSNGNQDGKQKAWDENSKLISESERKNGAWINNGFKYKKENLESIWFNLPNKEIIAFPENVSSFVFKTLRQDYNTKENLYKIIIQDKLTDDQLLSFMKETLDSHFSKIGTIRIDIAAWEHIPNITINYDVLNQGSIGDKERKLEYEAKEKEVTRIANLLAKNFPKLKIPGTTGSKQEKASIEKKESPSNAQTVNELMNVEEESSIEDIHEKTNKEIQLYNISDPDGYSNLRNVPKGDVIQKVYEGELFEVIGEDGDYKKVRLSNGTIGYIHGSRVNKK